MSRLAVALLFSLALSAHASDEDELLVVECNDYPCDYYPFGNWSFSPFGQDKMGSYYAKLNRTAHARGTCVYNNNMGDVLYQVLETPHVGTSTTSSDYPSPSSSYELHDSTSIIFSIAKVPITIPIIWDWFIMSYREWYSKYANPTSECSLTAYSSYPTLKPGQCWYSGSANTENDWTFFLGPNYDRNAWWCGYLTPVSSGGRHLLVAPPPHPPNPPYNSRLESVPFNSLLTTFTTQGLLKNAADVKSYTWHQTGDSVHSYYVPYIQTPIDIFKVAQPVYATVSTSLTLDYPADLWNNLTEIRKQMYTAAVFSGLQATTGLNITFLEVYTK